MLTTDRAETAASRTALAAVAALVALVAAEVHLTAGYAAVAAALVLFLAATAVIGRLLGARSARPTGSALLLTTSMRDFAIAAALATAAFGPGRRPAGPVRHRGPRLGHGRRRHPPRPVTGRGFRRSALVQRGQPAGQGAW
jgi:hypothetical protein